MAVTTAATYLYPVRGDDRTASQIIHDRDMTASRYHARHWRYA
jgi:hypothetical protein